MTKDRYGQEWDAHYPPGMGSAKFLPPPNGEFLRAYYMTSAEYAKSSISLSRLKVARFSDANDPFELMAFNAHRTETRRSLEQFRNSQNGIRGMLCFSENWTNPLLWSHYADKHKGICLGFDLQKGQVERVIYAKKRPRHEFSTGEEAQSILQNFHAELLLTKYIGWEYEHELRRFVDLAKTICENDLYFLPFDGDMRLREVILGVKNNLALEAIRALVKSTNPKAVVFKTRLERRDFRIVGDGNYRPEIPTDTA